MMGKVKSVEEYLSNHKSTFAYPLLCRLRSIINEVAPQAEENIKWGAPSFEYKGIMITLVAFKNSVALWFHKGALINDPENLLEASSDQTKSMRKYVIKNDADIHETALKALIFDALQKQMSGEQVKNFKKAIRTYKNSPLLDEALTGDKTASDNFRALSEARQYEYIEHIESAKQPATRQRRAEKSIELLRQGKGLYDKYKR